MHGKFRYRMFNLAVLFIIVIMTNGLLLLSSSLLFSQQVHADPLPNSIRQVIGNYNMEMKTDPKIPVAGQATKISLRISSVNGDDLVDLPIVISISKEGVELGKTHPIFVPYGHYTYEYTFSQTGVYALNIDVNDTNYSGQNLAFTFPINVAYSFAGYPISSLLLPVAAAGISIPTVVTGVIFLKRRRRRKNNGRKTIERTKT